MAAKTAFCHILQRSRVMDVKIGPSLGYTTKTGLQESPQNFDLGDLKRNRWGISASPELNLTPKDRLYAPVGVLEIVLFQHFAK